MRVLVKKTDIEKKTFSETKKISGITFSEL